MKIALEQLFYGRGERGYGMLGASPGGRSFASRVESLCGAVGTPNSDYGGEPFLLSVPEKDRVIMACGRRGAPDSMGRATLFFHVLIAAKADLSAAKADAFSLFEQGAFADKMPEGEFASACIDAVPSTMPRACGGDAVDVSFPCLFRSERPSPKLVGAVVGGQAFDFAWATFTFQFLPEFDVQVLPPRVQGLRTANEYDASGNLVRRAAGANARRVENRLDRDRPPMASACSSNVAKAPSPEKSNAMLKFSLVANLFLVAACAVLLALRKTATDSPCPQPGQMLVTNVVEKVVAKTVEAPLSAEQKTAIERAVIDRLKREFDGGKRIFDFDAEVRSSKLPRIERIVDKKDPEFDQARQFLETIRAYVDFVNKKILEADKP